MSKFGINSDYYAGRFFMALTNKQVRGVCDMFAYEIYKHWGMKVLELVMMKCYCI